MIRLQIAVIYLHAAVAKSAVPEWMNGTALYYWFTDPTFGAPSWLEPAVRILVTHGTALTLLTWSVVALEFSLFAGLFAKDRYLPILLVTGAFFHLGIALIHGLISFSIIMLGALILFLRPPNQEFHFLSVYDKLRWIYPIRKARRRMMLGGIPTTS
jgi:antimicrobial peptide system SdpB family protein